MDLSEELRASIFREIESAKEMARQASNKINLHEVECALRYTGIQATLNGQDQKLDKIVTKVDNGAWAANGKAWAIASAVFMALLGLTTWLAGQLWVLR